LKIFLIVFFIIFWLFSFSSQAHAATQNPPYQIIVSAAIGEPKLTLFGYASPQALVQLTGRQVAESVIANRQGYFLFDRILMPRPNPHYPELCLIAIDTHSLTSFPTCLPQLPTGPFKITVGPVLLPPTISLGKGYFQPGEQVKASGRTIPNTEVTIFLANDSFSRRPKLVAQAHAYSLPQYQIRSDQNGRFEFNLPTEPGQRQKWRIFAAASYLGAATPKSNTLVFQALSGWGWWRQWGETIFGLILGLLASNWPVLVIAVQILILGVLIKARLSKINPHSLR